MVESVGVGQTIECTPIPWRHATVVVVRFGAMEPATRITREQTAHRVPTANFSNKMLLNSRGILSNTALLAPHSQHVHKPLGIGLGTLLELEKKSSFKYHQSNIVL